MVVICTVGLDWAFLPRMPVLDLEDDALCVTFRVDWLICAAQYKEGLCERPDWPLQGGG